MRYKVGMGEEKVCIILSAHKARTQRRVIESLEKGWKTWSAHVAELQLLRADRENMKKQGTGFFKMDVATIIIV